jgi:hypothetical protein
MIADVKQTDVYGAYAAFSNVRHVDSELRTLHIADLIAAELFRHSAYEPRSILPVLLRGRVYEPTMGTARARCPTQLHGTQKWRDLHWRRTSLI